jgi:hypothetical protein
MWLIRSILVLIIAALICPPGQALQTFSGERISIDTPVADDIIAGGDIVGINSPVDSVIAAGGTVSINAPVKGDVIALAGQVYINSDVGGKVVVAGGSVHIGGDIGTNLVGAGEQVNLAASSSVNKDALLMGRQVFNAAKINGTLSVSANQFNNSGTAQAVRYKKIEDQGRRDEDFDAGYSIFSLLFLLGYFILGLILVKYLPGIFQEVDAEARRSTLFKILLGFVMIVAAFIALVILAASIVGLPIALISALLFMATLMLSSTFVSFSLGRWICEKAKMKKGDLAGFVLGFVVLNLLFYLPLIGGLISIVSMSLGFSSIIYASRRLAAVCR